jgi:hypothetical protein
VVGEADALLDAAEGIMQAARENGAGTSSVPNSADKCSAASVVGEKYSASEPNFRGCDRSILRDEQRVICCVAKRAQVLLKWS